MGKESEAFSLNIISSYFHYTRDYVDEDEDMARLRRGQCTGKDKNVAGRGETFAFYSLPPFSVRHH